MFHQSLFNCNLILELRISVTELMQHVKQGLNTKFIKKYYHDTYLVLLRDHILSKETCMGQIDIQDWSSNYQIQ